MRADNGHCLADGGTVVGAQRHIANGVGLACFGTKPISQTKTSSSVRAPETSSEPRHDVSPITTTHSVSVTSVQLLLRAASDVLTRTSF